MRTSTRRLRRTLACLALFALGLAGPALAQSDWTEPYPPFRIADNLY